MKLLIRTAFAGFMLALPLAAAPSASSGQAPPQPDQTSRLPNFVIIFTDDQGYGDLGCFGGKQVYTPNIDQMAKEGARLTSFYVAAPLCTPSRAALMTGCYPARIDMDVPSSLEIKMSHIPPGRKFPVCLAGDGRGLNPKELTIAEVAQSAGYKTGMFGKWHLGDQPEFLPTRQGFEEYFGIPYSHDIHPKHPRQEFFKFPPLPLLEGEEVIELAPDADYLTRRITERAVDFIKRNKSENFFLYVAHPLPHGPLAASPEIKKEYAKQLKVNGIGKPGIFPTTIYEIDWSVGEILKTLKEQGIDENTIVLFATDNGPAKGSAKPLRGRKGSTLEGGQRVPTVIRWPKGIPAGSDNDAILTAMDVLPTFAELSGVKLPDDLVIDGKDIMPTLVEGAKSPHEYFFYAHWGVLEGVRWKSWKLRIIEGEEALYNLDEDISEKKNVAADHPEIVRQLKAAMQGFEKDMEANIRPAGFVDNPVPLTRKQPRAANQGIERSDTPQPPNFVIIFADDLGYGDLGCYGAKYKTPALDRMAAEGFRSTDLIVPANVCCPSRAALLTGRYPMRNGLPAYRTADKRWNYGLHPDEITIAELLKTAGYRSLAVGKWHLGFEKEGAHPMDAGFDAYYGLAYNYSKRHGPENQAIYRDRDVEEKNVAFQVLTANYTREVVQFIEAQTEDQPFFIYLAHQIAHTPIAPSQPFIGLTKKGMYADFVTELDHSTGKVIQALREKGLDENTLVVFLADNGHTGSNGSGGPLAGGKYTTMEGGHRVPGIFRWTGRIPAGQVSGTTITSMDLLPLLCDLAGVEAPADRKIDGANIIDVLLGKTEESPHKFLYYYNGANLQAVRKGQWKLHLPRTAKDQPFWGKGGRSRRFYELEEPFLVNLETDIGEKHNVAADHPEVVALLQKMAVRVRAELGDVGQSGSDQRPAWPPVRN